MAMTADASDARALADRFRAAARVMADTSAVDDQAGRVVLAAARPPRRTGEMAARMFARASAGTVLVASSARYWTFVEYGAPRRRVRAQPFTRRALEETTREVVGLYAEHRADALRVIT